MNLPKSWSLVPLETIALPEKGAIRRGPFGGSLKKDIFVESGFKVYEQQNAISNNFQLGHYFIDEEKYREMEGFSVKPKDLIISCAGTIGRIAIAPNDAKPGVINQALMRIRPNTEIVSCRYLKWLLESPKYQRDIFGKSAGSALKNLAAISEIKKCEIPLPPLEEQQRIAAILDKADAVRRKRKEAISLTEELLRSTFLEMFGDLFAFIRPNVKKHSKGFEKCRLGSQITLQRGFDITKTQCYEGPYPVISSGGISAYHSEYKANGPGVLLGRKGSVGRVHYVETDYWPHDTTLWVREFNKNNPIFVYYFFKYFPISNFEESTSNPTLNRNRLHPLDVFWPPTEAQESFAKIFVSGSNCLLKEQNNLAEINNLFNSLLQRAFRGEL